ncbi:trans-2,3-dihydro-3-hydroxyanthranilate isomerase [Fontibacillus panacisegetis]|uniref:Trans-2,3-dihydro-3-hydroxyanthranilate isomerase n=1 Tax=Fontibacillus panacisegetis TaxID=670482 RepID=A0A1G7MA53_9BACL|nr:PhzF family phenazine biosynthesis protein [Fontibacillus panacisegetis]SDF58601.1 trans-2,3-dihydro-3-hydroxyanthranilate isomerase [Fontibacillus panacisegetis]
MDKMNYFIVDVFSEGKYTGNPLAVFKNAGELTDQQMQQIAKEINYSETTFIMSNAPVNGGYDVRIFTPNEEIPFAGHPTLGTAYIIKNEILEEAADELILNYKGGPISVSFSDQEEILWMKQHEPVFGRILDKSIVSEVLSIDPENIDDRFPIQEVSTGLPVIIVPLNSLEAAKRVKINSDKYYELIAGIDAKAVLVFSTGTYHAAHDLNVRDFAEYYGIPEDAATGSSNGCLAVYLVKYEYFGANEIDITVEQGYEIKRPSLLYLKAEAHSKGIHVRVGGQVVKVAQGEWLL